MKLIFAYIFSFLFVLVSCKNSDKNRNVEKKMGIPSAKEKEIPLKSNSVETKVKEEEKVIKDFNCLDEKTEHKRVEEFIESLINDIENSNVKELSTKIKFPIDIFSHGEISNESVFIDKFSDLEAFQKFFGLEVFNENGELKDVSTFDTIQIFYTEMENVSSCYYAQFGLGTEIYNIQEIDGVIKIVKFIGVG